MARVLLARSARDALDELDFLLADAVLDALDALERHPQAGYPLRGRLAGLWSYRVGVYRITYHLHDAKTVRVVAIRHRGQSYDTDPRKPSQSSGSPRVFCGGARSSAALTQAGLGPMLGRCRTLVVGPEGWMVVNQPRSAESTTDGRTIMVRRTQPDDAEAFAATLAGSRAVWGTMQLPRNMSSLVGQVL